MSDDVVYLREVDAGTDNSCMVVCAKGDPGALPYVMDKCGGCGAVPIVDCYRAPDKDCWREFHYNMPRWVEKQDGPK